MRRNGVGEIEVEFRDNSKRALVVLANVCRRSEDTARRGGAWSAGGIHRRAAADDGFLLRRSQRQLGDEIDRPAAPCPLELCPQLAAIEIVGRLEAVEIDHRARRVDRLPEERQRARSQRDDLIVEFERLMQIQVAKAEDSVEPEMIGLKDLEEPIQLVTEELARVR